MSKLNLVENGIFPIVKDKEGKLIEGYIPDTGFALAGTLQGEGILSGVACLFIRTSGCNLRCLFADDKGGYTSCDTSYSSHYAETNLMDLQEIVDIVKHNIGNMEHIVISGGEPMLQAGILTELIKEIRAQVNPFLKFTVETNGTIFHKDFAGLVNLYSLSPKLKTSTPTKEAVEKLNDPKIKYNAKWEARHENERKEISVIQKFIDSCFFEDGSKNLNKDFQLKFVISKPEDIIEIKEDFLSKLKNWKKENILLMPEGITAEELATRSKWVAQLCIEEGFRFCPRLHVLLFGLNRSV